MNQAILLWLALCVGVSAYALLRLPTWLLSSMNRGALWRLRDSIFDARRTGQLPDNPSVADLIDKTETFILVLPFISAVQVWWLSRRLDIGPGRSGNAEFLPAAEGMNEVQRSLFVRYQHEFAHILLRQYFTGSWSGLLLAAPRNRANVRHVLAPGEKHRWDFHHGAQGQEASTVHVDPVERQKEIVERVERAAPHMRTSSHRDLISAAG